MTDEPQVGMIPVEVNRAALVTADCAYVDEPEGTPSAGRVKVAIHAYLWHLANVEERSTPAGGTLLLGPSLNMWRAYRATRKDLPW